MRFWPDTHHKVFNDSAEEIRQFLNQKSEVVVNVSKSRPLHKTFEPEDPTLFYTSYSLIVFITWANAPWTGKPYLYNWKTAVDVTGKFWVSGSVKISYVPYNIELNDYSYII